MSRTRTTRLIALLAVMAMSFSACSSSDSESQDSSSESSSQASSEGSSSAASASETGEESSSEASSEATEAAADTPTEVTVETFFGEALTVGYQPKTIVVLDYAALDTLDYLGLGDRVVGIPSSTSVPPYLSAYETTAENIGSLFEADFEAINALAPDLIIAGGRSQSIIGELSEIAPTLDMTFEWGSATFLESLTTNTTAVGEIFGLQDEVVAVLAELEASAKSVSDQAADDGTGLVIMTSGGEVSAYGPGEMGRYDLVYNILGVNPAVEQIAIDTHGDAISFEFLAETNPDLLIVLDRDAAIGADGDSAQAILDNDLVNGTNAVTNGKVVYVETAKWYLSFGGLSSYESMIAAVDSIVD